MHTVALALDGSWRVLLVSLVLGAGLPALFALGVRSLAFGIGGSAEADIAARPHPIGRLLAALCFGLVVLFVALGITVVVASGFGKQVSFEHVYPTVVDK
ncbi:hypothetical protein [Millisia brevis]|uniref:hypothetical protein n=1 Tax=Millisia brevis TaxID=264148 RepID=UPI00082E6232|nr:hypothetical protein [Millisia brevis]